MRPSLLPVVVVVVVTLRSPVDNIRQIPGGQKHAPRSYRIWSSYVGADGIMPDYGYSSPSAGNPAWPSIVLLLGVPALVMDPEMGLWPRDGSTILPQSELAEISGGNPNCENTPPI